MKTSLNGAAILNGLLADAAYADVRGAAALHRDYARLAVAVVSRLARLTSVIAADEHHNPAAMAKHLMGFTMGSPQPNYCGAARERSQAQRLKKSG
jgi:hypothetical protein